MRDELARAIGADPALRHHVESEGFSILHVAAYWDSAALAREALEGQAVDARDSLQRTPLMISMQCRHILGARLLLAARADVAAQDESGHTSLSIAARCGHAEGVLLLMSRGGSTTLEIANKNGMRPLHWAASSGDSFGVKLLLRLRSNAAARTHSGLSAADLASNGAHWHVVSCLESLKPSSNSVTYWSSGDITSDRGGDSRKYQKRLHALDCQYVLQQALQEIMHPSYVTRKLVPVLCHMAAMLAIYEHLSFSRTARWKLAPHAAAVFEVAVPAVLGGFQYIARMDPGVVPENSGIERLMRMIDSEMPPSALPQLKQLCTTTWVLKGPRTKYCSVSGTCIERFDHYCVLLDTPIGRGNHRFFLFLMLVEVIAQVSHFTLCLTTLLSDERARPLWQALLLVSQHPALALLVVVHCATLPGIMCLIIVQLVLISQNLTVNELINMRRYEHFWKAPQAAFFNPFSKGSSFRNCMDFWWKERSFTPNFEEMHV